MGGEYHSLTPPVNPYPQAPPFDSFTQMPGTMSAPLNTLCQAPPALLGPQGFQDILQDDIFNTCLLNGSMNGSYTNPNYISSTHMNNMTHDALHYTSYNADRLLGRFHILSSLEPYHTAVFEYRNAKLVLMRKNISHKIFLMLQNRKCSQS